MRGALGVTGHFHEKAGFCQAIFLGRANHTADCRPTGGRVSFQSFLHRKVFSSGYQYSRSPTSGRRTMLPFPNSQITDSPYFHPHSLWSYGSRASWVSSIGNGCCRLVAELNVPVSSDVVPRASRSHPNSAISSKPVKRQLFSVPVVRCDSAMARTLHRLPTADEAGSLVFVQPPQPLFSCHAFLHV